MSSIYSIYRSKNTITGKSYIGFDSQWPKRKDAHKKRMYDKNNIKFYNALKKYGWDNFEWEVVYQSLDGEHCLQEMETFFVMKYNSFNNGYNSTLGGEGVIGYKHNKERREKIRLNNIGRKYSDEVKNHRSLIMKEKWKTRNKKMSH